MTSMHISKRVMRRCAQHSRQWLAITILNSVRPVHESLEWFPSMGLKFDSKVSYHRKRSKGKPAARANNPKNHKPTIRTPLQTWCLFIFGVSTVLNPYICRTPNQDFPDHASDMPRHPSESAHPALYLLLYKFHKPSIDKQAQLRP